MIKKIAATGIVLISTMTGCVSPADTSTVAYAKTIQIKNDTNFVEKMSQTQQSLFRKATLQKNSDQIDLMLSLLKTRVGKTWYVFSGATPSGWDCSGLVMWGYGQIGINLEHRATKQANSGFLVDEPVPGDIVVFKYKGYSSAYHVGIYVGNGKMIHAPRKGEVTRIESITSFGGNYSSISYRRLLETI